MTIDIYMSAVRLRDGLVFRPVNKGGKITHYDITEQTIYQMVAEYAQRLGFGTIAPHDLGRTFVKLAQKGGSALDQINSPSAMERYLGVEQDLTERRVIT